jgi:hypothetical protein
MLFRVACAILDWLADWLADFFIGFSLTWFYNYLVILKNNKVDLLFLNLSVNLSCHSVEKYGWSPEIALRKLYKTLINKLTLLIWSSDALEYRFSHRDIGFYKIFGCLIPKIMILVNYIIFSGFCWWC